MKKKVFLLATLLLSVVITSCSNDSKDDDVVEKVVVPSGSENIALSGTETKQVTFTATSDWKIVINEKTRVTPSWVSVEPMSGKAGENTIAITLKEKNTTTEDRKAEILIQAGNGTPVPITITQAKEEAPTVLNKRITSITFRDEEGVTEKLNLTYDEKGRLTKFSFFNITYTETTFTIKTNRDTGKGTQYIADFIYQLADGKATSYSGTETEIYEGTTYTDKTEYTLEYANNKVSKINVTEPEQETLTFTWQEGNITQMDLTDAEEYPLKFTYGEEPNNMNLNLFALLYMTAIGDMDFADLADLKGERTTHLPSKITNNEGSMNMTYTRNKEGYITKIGIEVGSESMEHTFSYE